MSAKLAVGQVVMNRVHSPEFPDTVHDVVFQRTCGVYEFSPVANGTIYNTPSAESIQAAKEVLSGSVNIVPSALVFYNPSLTSKGNWVRQRHVIESIGHLTFAE
jgi:N-acetylmuramoyl-L-alanine amidase